MAGQSVECIYGCRYQYKGGVYIIVDSAVLMSAMVPTRVSCWICDKSWTAVLLLLWLLLLLLLLLLMLVLLVL